MNNGIRGWPVETNNAQARARAWVKFLGATGVVLASYNVSAVVRLAAGRYQVYFAYPFMDGKYVVAAMGARDINKVCIANVAYNDPAVETMKEITFFEMNVAPYLVVGVNALWTQKDPYEVHVVVFGN